MSGQVVCDISISADGYVAGTDQRAEKPFGDGPIELLHAWMFDTPEENKAETEQILTHHAREPLTMDGGTTFTFVTGGIEAALTDARAAAGDRDARAASLVTHLTYRVLH